MTRGAFAANSVLMAGGGPFRSSMAVDRSNHKWHVFSRAGSRVLLTLASRQCRTGKENHVRHWERDPLQGMGSGSKGKGPNPHLLFGFNTPLAVLGPIPMALIYPGSPAVAFRPLYEFHARHDHSHELTPASTFLLLRSLLKSKGLLPKQNSMF